MLIHTPDPLLEFIGELGVPIAAEEDVLLTCRWTSAPNGDPVCSACADGVKTACDAMGIRWVHPSLVGTSTFDQLADSADLSHALRTLCRPDQAAPPPFVLGRYAAMRRLLEPYEQLVELGLAEPVVASSRAAGDSAFAPLITKPEPDRAHGELRGYRPTGYGLRMFDALADVAEAWSADA